MPIASRHLLARPSALLGGSGLGARRYTRIADLVKLKPAASGTPVQIAGRVQTVRKQKRVAFAAVQDGSTIAAAQVVLDPAQAAALSTGSAVVIKGRWVDSFGGKEQAHELRADDVIPQGENDATTYPIQKKYQSLEFLRTFPHLRVRTSQNALLLRLRSQVIASATTFFNDHGFVQTHTPIITSSDCEGAGEVFTVASDEAALGAGDVATSSEPDHFFGDPKYLTVSSQLHLEALAQSVGKVWTLSPTFRAEKSDTARHLSEFYMLEAEVAYTEDLHDIMDLVEDLVRNIARDVQSSHVGQELLALVQESAVKDDVQEDKSAMDHNGLANRWAGLTKASWPRVSFAEACSTLHSASSDKRAQFVALPDETTGLSTEHERYLADVVCQGPVFITDYPQAIKPFYMAPSARGAKATASGPTVSCFDLLLPEVCEVVGGSMREHRLGPLKERMAASGLLSRRDGGTEDAAEESGLAWYLDLRRYGSVPHGGFGLGFDRLLAFLSGVANVRDVVTFPRYYKKCRS